MKVRQIKSFSQLSKGEQDKLIDAMNKDVEYTCEHNFAKLQKIWLQYACIILHDKLGLDKTQCILFLGHWRELYKKNAKFDHETEQSEYLKSRMNEIFGDDYPYDFIDKLEQIK